MTISDFWNCTPLEFANWVTGFFESEYEEYKRTAELQRVMTLILVNTQMGKKPIKNPKKLIEFAWEKEKPVKLTTEQINALKNW